MALPTTTLTGVLYAPDGTPYASETVEIRAMTTAVSGVPGGGRVPELVTAVTDASGEIGTDSGGFSAGVELSLGQYLLTVHAVGRSYQAQVTIDQNMIDAGVVSLFDAIGPAPAPPVVTAAQEARDAAQTARDKARQWAESPENVEVEPDKFSALHHATKAGEAAAAAAEDRAATEAARDATADALSVTAAPGKAPLANHRGLIDAHYISEDLARLTVLETSGKTPLVAAQSGEVTLWQEPDGAIGMGALLLGGVRFTDLSNVFTFEQTESPIGDPAAVIIVDASGNVIAAAERSGVSTYPRRLDLTLDGPPNEKPRPSGQWHILNGGQSNAVGSGLPRRSTPRDFEFSGGLLIKTTDTGNTLTQLASGGDGGSAKSALAQMRYMMQRDEGLDQQALVSSFAVNGQSVISFAPPDSEFYLDALHQIDEGARLLPNYVLAGHVWIQGEADRDRTYEIYRSQLTSLIDGLRDHAKSLGQTFDPVHFLYQPVSEHYDYTGRRDPIVSRATYDLDAERDDCVLVAPLYALPHRDNVHLDRNSYALFGGQIGKAMYKRLWRGEDWTCLRPSSVVGNGNTITLTLVGAVNGLTFDTISVTDPGNFGFRVISDGGDLTISNIEITSGRNVRITTATPLDTLQNPILQYAWDIVGPHSVTGVTDGPRGNLRDNDPTVWAHDGITPLHNWCARFSEQITITGA